MSILQYSFITVLAVFLIVIIYLLKRRALSLKYSLLWLFSGLMMLITSIFPGILSFVARKLGFQLPSNALFALVLGFLIMILLSITSIVSRQAEKIRKLTQASALLEKRVREMEENAK